MRGGFFEVFAKVGANAGCHKVAVRRLSAYEGSGGLPGTVVACKSSVVGMIVNIKWKLLVPGVLGDAFWDTIPFAQEAEKLMVARAWKPEASKPPVVDLYENTAVSVR